MICDHLHGGRNAKPHSKNLFTLSHFGHPHKNYSKEMADLTRFDCLYVDERPNHFKNINYKLK